MAKKEAPKAPAARSSAARPLAVLAAVVGLIFIAFYFVAERAADSIAVISSLGRWNLLVAGLALIVAVLAFRASHQAPEPASGRSGPQPQRVGNRWAAPAMIASAVIGLIWIVTFYVTNGTAVNVPVMTDLGNWNLVVGMGFIVSAFGFAMKWE